MPPDLHPDLEDLAPLLGIWAGQGAGKYPTIQPFEYFEEVVFSHVGKPFLAYAQKTKAVADGKPLHAETGYLRVPKPGHVELVLAHPSGITSLAVGANPIVVEDNSTSIRSPVTEYVPASISVMPFGWARTSSTRPGCGTRR